MPLYAHAATNLISNPSFETGTNNPTGWVADWFGTNGFTFTYPVTGSGGGGTKAAKITGTGIGAGSAAWWGFGQITVTPGTLYYFSDKYISDVETKISVVYKVHAANSIAGECNPNASDPAFVSCSEVVSSSISPSSSFKSFSTAIAPPAGTVSMTIQHMLTTNGSLTVDDYVLQEGLDASNAYSQGVVSLTFDDGTLDHYNTVFPMLKTTSLHGTFYLISNFMDNPNFAGAEISSQQMLEMQAAGNDMTAHTADHCDLVALFNDPNSAMNGGVQTGSAGSPGIGCPAGALSAPKTSTAEITESKTKLDSLGATPDDSLAYPYGKYNAGVESEIQGAGFKAARSIDFGYNTKATDPFALVVQHLDSSRSAATIHSWIDTALASKAWLILVFHKVTTSPTDQYDISPTTLQDTLNYLKQKQGCVLTVTQMLNGAPCGSTTATTTPPIATTTPTISNITTTSVTSTGVTVTWTTNEAATSQVEYGTSTSYGASTTLNASLGTSHSVALTGLAGATTYHFRVYSKNAAGNQAVSGDGTFTTNAAQDTVAPVLSAITVGSITSTGASVQWTTNEGATSQVEYGTSTAYGATTTLDASLVTSHSVALSGLASSTLYHVRVISKDAAGNTATSSDSTFTTLAAEVTPPTTTTTETTTTQTPVVATGGGGGGGGGGNGPIFGSFGLNIAGPVFTPLPPNTGGSVLGTSIFRFAQNLWRGMHHGDVTELQKRLKSENFLTIDSPTDFFGPLTFAAVKKYQAAHGIESIGMVGPKTRASLNLAVDDPQRAAALSALKAQYDSLLEQVKALSIAR